jgi:hypothetical protein
MMFRSSLLLGGVVMLAAIPVCADSISYRTSTIESSNRESSAPTFRTFHTKFITPAAAQLIQESLPTTAPAWTFTLGASSIVENPTQTEISRNETRTFALALADPQDIARVSGAAPATLSINSFQASGAFGSSGPETSMVLGTLVPTESQPSVHSSNPVEFSSSEPFFSEFSTAGSRLGFFGNDSQHDRGGKGKEKDQNGPPVNVPEPGALPLFPLELLAVGIMSLRNRDITTNA